jgi:multidrug efflux pump subunit AcrA (membrane-fusion protein)
LAGAAGSLGPGARGARRQQTVYVVAAGGDLKPVPVKTGISDGRFTSITEGSLSPGDKIAVGIATAKADQTGSLPAGMGGRGPGGGGGRRF